MISSSRARRWNLDTTSSDDAGVRPVVVVGVGVVAVEDARLHHGHEDLPGEELALPPGASGRSAPACACCLGRVGRDGSLIPGGPVSGGQVTLAGRGLVQANGSSNEGRESLLIDFIVLVEVDCAPGVAFEA
jgi:hypothetical protein